MNTDIYRCHYNIVIFQYDNDPKQSETITKEFLTLWKASVAAIFIDLMVISSACDE